MLEKLQEIDWNALKAPEMPDWIRGLASTDTDIREAAYDSIYFECSPHDVGRDSI
jgi:hypothetical protein